MLIDAHIHLQDARLDVIRPHMKDVLRSENIGCLVVNGTTEADWSRVVDCKTSFPQVIPSFGLHPWWIDQRSSNWFQNLEFHLKTHHGAVGEIGLDRWLSKDNIEDQEQVFLAQWEMANRLRLPVSVHCLKAWGRLLDLIRRYPHEGPGFLLHSYSGPLEMVDEWVKLGARFSLSGYFAQARKASRKPIFQRIPVDRILIETDAPDMIPPEEMRTYDGGRDPKQLPINHPGNLRCVYQLGADWLEIPIEELEAQAQINFNQMFGSFLSGVGPNY